MRKSKSKAIGRSYDPFSFHYLCWLPENLDLDELLVRDPLIPKTWANDPEKVRNRLSFVVGSLSSAIDSALDKGSIESENGYVGLCTDIFQKVFREYTPYVEYAVRNCIFERGSSYSNGVSCTQYRFGAKYRNKTKKPYYIYEKLFVKSIYKRQQDREAIAKYRQQYDWLNATTVDWSVAEKALDSLYGTNNSEG